MRQRGSEAARQRGSEAARQRDSEAARQPGSLAARQVGWVGKKHSVRHGGTQVAGEPVGLPGSQNGWKIDNLP